MHGVAEEPVDFLHDDAFGGGARFRRFGDHGPAYEVLRASNSQAFIRLLENGEEAALPLAEVMADPLA